jgi:hypothetical protein
MLKSVFVGAGALILAVLSGPSVEGLSSAAPQGQRPTSAKPERRAAERHDTSRPLRDMPPVPPARRTDPDEREPHLVRQIVRGRGLPDPVIQRSAGRSRSLAPAQSTDGVGNVNGVLPPDTNAAVGPNHYVHAVNVSFAIYSKGDASTPPSVLYGPADTSTIWTGFGGPCEARNDGDSIIMYDHLADRWVISQLALPNLFFGIAIAPFYQCVAVSATSDPTGGYHRYQFAFNKLNDYPKLAVWPDAYYMTINQFSSITLQWAGQGVIAFDREKMLVGLPATMQYMDLASVDANLGGMLPADLDGPAPPSGSPGYFVQMDDDAWGYSSEDRLQLWRFHVDWTTPSASTFTGPSLIPVAPFDTDMCAYARTCIPQRGTDVRVDAMADRLMYRLQYRNFDTHETLVVNHTVDVDGTDHAGVRWYEIRAPRSTPFVHQQGTFAPDASHRWMASAAMDGAGNLAIGYSVSGSSVFPSVRYTGRQAGDPPGAMTLAETELATGTGSQLHATGRWGDYSMMAVDPSDDCTFWYTQQYYTTTSQMDWRTKIGTFSFPSCGASSALPRVSVVAATPTATEAGSSPGALTFARSGDTADALPVVYTVGGTAQPSVDYVPLSGTAVIPAGAAETTILVTPIDDVYNEPGETVAIGLAPNAAYTIGSPSQAVVTITSDDLPADLTVTSLTVPASGLPGGTLAVTSTTSNNGGAAPASATGFYLSTNYLFDASDVKVGTRTIAPLLAGFADTGTTDVQLPSTLATGIYYVIARADDAAAIAESNENNNLRFSTAIRVGPDLTVSALSASPIAVGPGSTVTVTDTTRNQGSALAGPTSTAILFSVNALLDAGDMQLGSRNVPALAPNAVSTGVTTVQVPASVGTGTYYLFARADVNNQTIESQETNNGSFPVSLRVGPDMTVSALSAPSSVIAGSTINVTDTTSNIGGGAAAASVTKFYISVNLSVDAGDIVLGTRGVNALAASGVSIGTTPFVVPATLAPGSYWLIAVADSTGAVAETYETNNSRLVFMRVTVGG